MIDFVMYGTIRGNIPIFALSAQGAQRMVGVRGRVDNENCKEKQPAEHEKNGSSTKAKASSKGAWVSPVNGRNCCKVREYPVTYILEART